MNQLKFSLGPYEVFSSIVGGIPLLIAGCLIYSPFESVPDLLPLMRANLSVPIAIATLAFSYVMGGAIQGLSWRYFVLVCKLFGQNHRYFGNAIQEKNDLLLKQNTAKALNSQAPDFEEKIVLALRSKIGIPKQSNWMNARIMSYLRERNKQSTLGAIERYTAQHIMYRTWSLGFCAITLVVFINPFRISAFTLEQWLLPVVTLFFAYATFFQALRHQRWRNREIILGFYFAETERR